MVKSKVTASTLAAAVGGYVVNLLADNFGLHLSADLQALVVAAVTSLAVFVAGYLKREHVISDETYRAFTDAEKAADVRESTPAPKHAAEPAEVKPAASVAKLEDEKPQYASIP